MSKYNLDLDKIYQIPSDIHVVNYDSKFLVIASEFANWIVLDSAIQLQIFEYLNDHHSLREALTFYENNEDDLKNVVTQIEARSFCSKQIHSSAEDGRSMHIYLTNKCNLACPHCYMFSGRADRHELTTEEVIRLITDYKNVADGKTITLSGGEPTTRSDFKTMVKAAKALGLQVSVLSNGTLFTEDDANELSQYIDSLQISLDGYSEESNSKVRGKGNFGKAIKTIEYFVTHGVRTSVSITPQPLCLRQHTADFARFAKELTDRYKDYDFEVRFADELLKGRNIDPTDDEKKEYFNLINGILKEIYGPDYDVMYFVRNLYFGAIIDNCMFGIFAIAANGDVYFCTRVGDQSPIANVRDVSMAEISRMSHAAEKASRITNLTPCKNCELRYICGGGCRIDNFPTLVKNTNFENINYAQISRTPCSTDTKNHFYDLMIRSNKYFFQEL